MKFYITNLRSEVTKGDLRNLFETKGKVANAQIVKTLTTNEPTGLGIVEMASHIDAIVARKELDGKLLKGNSIKIFNRRSISNRCEGTDRRVLDVPRDIAERRQKDRRQKSGEGLLLSVYAKLDKREVEERRSSRGRRILNKRRMRERRFGLG